MLVILLYLKIYTFSKIPYISLNYYNVNIIQYYKDPIMLKFYVIE